MALVRLSTKTVGAVVKTKESGTAVNFIVAQHNYQNTGRTLLVRQSLHSKTATFCTYGKNEYAGGDADTWCNVTYLATLPTNIQAQIANVTIPIVGQGGEYLYSISRKCFLLSGTELGFAGSLLLACGTAIPYFNTSTRNMGEAWWTRSPAKGTANGCVFVFRDGTEVRQSANVTGNQPAYRMRPAFTLPGTIWVNDNGELTVNSAPTVPPSLTHGQPEAGKALTITAGQSTDPDGDIITYVYERRVDTQLFQQIAATSSLTITDTVPTSGTNYQVRVKARDSHGLESDYRNSTAQAIKYNQPPTTPSGLTYPQPRAGQSVTITTNGSTDPEGHSIQYTYERRIDSGAWQQIAISANRTITDTAFASITSGATYQVRVKATDSQGAESAYFTGTAQTIIYNDPPKISGSDTDLGNVTDTGITYKYTVTDDKTADVTVTIALNGTTYQTTKATPGVEQALNITGDAWTEILNGIGQVITITATDTEGEGATRRITFAKDQREIELQLAGVRESEHRPYRIAVNLSASLPIGSTFTVKACNNALDTSPAWEDITPAVNGGLAHVFNNYTCTAGSWAVNVWVQIQRAEAAEPCTLTGLSLAYETDNGVAAALTNVTQRMENTEELLELLLTDIIPGIVKGGEA